jgi:hypothetical protein
MMPAPPNPNHERVIRIRVPQPSIGKRQGNEAMPPLTQLPTELLVHVLSYLPPPCLANVAETSRVLNTVVTHSDSLWEAFCQPLPGHAPYESWRELYVTVWHNWSWLVGFWCGEHRHNGTPAVNFHLIAGCLMIGRYNDKNGLIDCHVGPLNIAVLIR